MGSLRAQLDLMGECNPGSKVRVDEFAAAICSQCANFKCYRSRYKDDATQAKIERSEKLLEFVDPHVVNSSPLSEYPDIAIHRAEPETLVESSNKIDAALEDLTAIQKQPLRPKDPWQAPSAATLHKEWATPEQDPWSVSYSGSIDRKVGSNATIRIPGKRRS